MVRDARHTVNEAGSTTIETVKTNPIPAALVAVGLGWLIVSGMRSGRSARFGGRRDPRIRTRMREGGEYSGIDEDGYPYTYRPGGTEETGRYGKGGGERLVERAKSVATDVEEKVSNVAHRVAHDVADKADRLAGGARGVAVRAERQGRRGIRRAGVSARRVEQTAERQLRENPIAFGALALAVGAAVGLLLPHTEVEDRLVGEKKDRLLDTAKQRAESAAQHALSSVQEKAGKMTENLNGLSSRPHDTVANGFSKHV